MLCFSGASRSHERAVLNLKLCASSRKESWKWENLGQLAVGVAHDFNNVLASISGFAELIASTEDAHGAVREYAQGILNAAALGQSAVKELQGLVRPGAETLWEGLDLHQVLRQSLAMVKAALGPMILVEAHLASGPARMAGNRALLQNVFINLFLNARDAMPEGGHLTVGTQRRDGSLVISVADTGTGMSREVMACLFRRFHTTKGKKGTGLGLYNARTAVERHGGRIEAHSAPGEGTEFRVTLPLADEVT